MIVTFLNNIYKEFIDLLNSTLLERFMLNLFNTWIPLERIRCMHEDINIGNAYYYYQLIINHMKMREEKITTPSLR